MKKVVCLILSLAVCMLFLVGCSKEKSAEKATTGPAKVIKVGISISKDRSLSKGLFKFAELVEKESGGAMKVQVFTDGVVGDDRRLIESLQLGSLQISTASTAPVAAVVPEMGVFDLPFLFKDRATAYKVLDGPIGQEILDKTTPAGFIGLCYFENGFRHTTNNKREITTLEDFKGLKIRTMETSIHLDIWKALGVNPTPMSYSQLYSAMEQKVVDGQENPLGNIRSSKFDEVQKYLTLTGHVYSPNPVFASKAFWDSLNDKEKAIIKKAAIEARDYQRKLNEEEDNTCVTYLKSKGMVISELKPGEKEKIIAAEQVVYDKYKKEFGEALVNKLLEAVK